MSKLKAGVLTTPFSDGNWSTFWESKTFFETSFETSIDVKIARAVHSAAALAAAEAMRDVRSVDVTAATLEAALQAAEQADLTRTALTARLREAEAERSSKQLRELGNPPNPPRLVPTKNSEGRYGWGYFQGNPWGVVMTDELLDTWAESGLRAMLKVAVAQEIASEGAVEESTFSEDYHEPCRSCGELVRDDMPLCGCGFCQDCGRKVVGDDAEFCMYCRRGKQDSRDLPVQSAVEESTFSEDYHEPCRSCGELVRDDLPLCGCGFCQDCGRKVVGDDAEFCMYCRRGKQDSRDLPVRSGLWERAFSEDYHEPCRSCGEPVRDDMPLCGCGFCQDCGRKVVGDDAEFCIYCCRGKEDPSDVPVQDDGWFDQDDEWRDRYDNWYDAEWVQEYYRRRETNRW